MSRAPLLVAALVLAGGVARADGGGSTPLFGEHGSIQLPSVHSPLNGTKLDPSRLTGEHKCTAEELVKYELSPDDAYALGRSVAERVLAPYVETDGAAPNLYAPDSPAALYLNQVGQVVAQAAISVRDVGTGKAGSPRSHPDWSRVSGAVPDRPLPSHGYTFILVKDPIPNAYGLPGGIVIITDGLMMRAGSEEQLAGVLAHEVAHVQRGHGVELIKRIMCSREGSFQQLGKEGVKEVADVGRNVGKSLNNKQIIEVSEKTQKMLNTMLDGTYATIVDQGYGELTELEADAFATRFLVQAGYAALGEADLLRRVRQDPTMAAGQEKTHPPIDERFDAILEQIAAEKLDAYARSPHEIDRNARFVKAMVDSGLRPDWKESLQEASPAPAAPTPTRKRSRHKK